MNTIFSISEIDWRCPSSKRILISYSESPVRNLLSSFPLKAVRIVPPTVAILSPSMAILSRSRSTLISGLPASELSFISVAPGIVLSSSAVFCAYSCAFSTSSEVTTKAIGACSAPISPTGTVFTLASTKYWLNSLLSLAAIIVVDSLRSFLSTRVICISDL